MQICEHPLTSIKFDPTHLILVSAKAIKQVFAVSLIDKKYDYVYLEMGANQFCTVELDHKRHKDELLRIARNKKISKLENESL